MASCLLKCECVDLSRKLYNMTWWATALNQISVPSGMNMCGGSVAIITTSGGVESYHYNSSSSSWKKDSSISDIYSDMDALWSEISGLQFSVTEEMPQLEYGLVNNVTVSANGTNTFEITYQHEDWSYNIGDEDNPEYAWEVPVVLFSFFATEQAVGNVADYAVSVAARTRSGFTAAIKNNSSSSRTPYIYWVAITKPYVAVESDGE